MKVKRIIDIDSELIEKIKNSLPEWGARYVAVWDATIRDAIKDSKPYDDSGDLISREALKEQFRKAGKDYDHECVIEMLSALETIANAPTVERPQGEWLEYNAQAVEITEEQAINKLHETGWLIGHDKEMTTRPQGEWIDKGHGRYECSVCGHFPATQNGFPWLSSFCPECGAEMRKGAAEND